MNERDKNVLKEIIFTGKISVNNFEEDITFTTYASQDFRLIIEPFNVSIEAYFALEKSTGKPGNRSTPITLTGKSSDGTSFLSQNAYFFDSERTEKSQKVFIATGQASITFIKSKAFKENIVKLHLRGYKSFSPKVIESNFGEIIVSGSHNTPSADDVSGEIIVRCTKERLNKDWHKNAEALADFIRMGLQFGRGGRLQVPLVEVHDSNELIATFNSGSGASEYLPAIHFLDQSEFIAALVARFEDEKSFPDAVWQAASWFNNDSPIMEIRYLTLMTAIETITTNLTPEKSSSMIPKHKFYSVRDELLQKLDDCDLNEEEFSILTDKIKGINRSLLFKQFEAVLKAYNLYEKDHSSKVFKKLNKQRNSIVHKGKSLEDSDLLEYIRQAREIIVLIIFSELHYQGRYFSYVDGYEERTMRKR